jgi:hypothetical protein
MWVCRLLQLCGSFKMLNRQLTQPPCLDRPFKLGVWPVPGTLNWAPDTFERIFERGSDPDSNTFVEPNEDGSFNLFARVAEHLPTSSDWLFKPLAPYFNKEPPPVDYATLLIDSCLRRLHMRRLGADAAEFAAKHHAGRTAEVGRQVLAAVSESPDPIHLILLYALYHERQWHQPNSEESDELGQAFIQAYDRFVRREEFTATPVAREACGGLRAFFYDLDRIVLHQGHRSRRPLDQSWTPMWHPNLVIGHPLENAEALDLYISMGVAVPIWAFAHQNLPPTKPQGIAALDRLCDRAATTPKQWAIYDADHPDVHRQARRKYLRAWQRIGASQAKAMAPKMTSDDAMREMWSPPKGIIPRRLNLEDLGVL